MATKRQDILSNLAENMMQIRRVIFSTIPAQKKSMPTFAQMGALMVLDNAPERTSREISKHFRMSASAATQLVDALVAKKLLIRKIDKSDGRKILLSLTPRGKQHITHMKKMQAIFFKKMFSGLSDKELSTFAELQKKILKSL